MMDPKDRIEPPLTAPVPPLGGKVPNSVESDFKEPDLILDGAKITTESIVYDDQPAFPGQSAGEAKTVPQMLRDAAAIYEGRNKTYGNNYKEFGKWANELFPNGIEINTVAGWNRLGVLVMMMSKIGRYAHNFADGGHADSLDDLVVYSMMLQELDNECRAG